MQSLHLVTSSINKHTKRVSEGNIIKVNSKSDMSDKDLLKFLYYMQKPL